MNIFIAIFEVLVIVFVVLTFLPKYEKPETKEDLKRSERDGILEYADVLSRKARYETKSFATRIHQVVNRCFDDFKIIDNLILEDEDGVEHQIPLLCATSKGVILFQTADYPGKGLFGSVEDDYWQIAQSADIAQNVPNSAVLSMHNALLIKRITGIDVKPIVVISKYTPSEKSILSCKFGQRVIMEKSLERELMDMAKYGSQNYPPEFLVQVKEKLLAINVSDEEEDEEENSDIPVEAGA